MARRSPEWEDTMSKETYVVVIESGATLQTEVREMPRTFFDHKLRTCTRKSPTISSPEHKCNNGDEVYSFETKLQDVLPATDEGEDTGSIYLYRVVGEIKLPESAQQLESVDGLVALLTTDA